jgi:hypothetical protein
MMKARGSMQASWGTTPNRGQHTAGPSDPMKRRRGSRVPLVGTPADLGKGTGVALTLDGVAQPKEATMVVMQGRRPCDGGTDHHDDRGSGGVGR